MANYEFTDHQNRTMNSLAKRLAIFGILIGLGGVAIVISAIGYLRAEGFSLAHYLFFLIGIVTIVMGIVFYRPSDNLKRIVTTEGSDVQELMTALKELRGGFKLLSYLVGAIAILAVIAAISLAVGG